MPTNLAIYKTRDAAERAARHVREAVPRARAHVLGPEVADRDLPFVPKNEAEQPGPGTALGGVVGGAAGAAGGMALGTAAAALAVPGVGPALAAGAAAAAVLGAAGAAAGAVAAHKLDEEMFEGVPRDEIYVYEDALRQGRFLVAVTSEEEDEKGVKEILEASGAESLDIARETWWIGLRDAERSAYLAAGGDFDAVEADFRHGFEAAIRGGDAPGENATESYRRGFARGEAFAAARGVKAAV
jgi:hypothetical protein